MRWAAKRVHGSWLVAVISFGILSGVLTAHYLPAGFMQSMSWLLLGAIIAAVALRWNYRFMVISALVAGGLIGIWRGGGEQIALRQYQSLYGHTLEVKGHLKNDVDIDASGHLRLRLEQVQIEGYNFDGAIWVSTASGGDIKRGDTVVVRGLLNEGFGSFVGSIYRAQVLQVTRPVPGDVAGRWRDNFAEQVREVVPEPQASLGLGYVVGQRRWLPPELDDDLRIAGLTHVVVASGFHLSTLVRFARRLFARISKFLATATTVGVMSAFIAVTGFSPSMARAALVTSFSLAAWYYGRKFHPLVLLLIVAALTVLIEPSYIWGSMGWQLSFGAFAGVMILAPLMQRYFFGVKKPGAVRQILGETIAAQIATWPILVYGFHQFSTVATVSNLLILPLVPLAMLFTFVSGVVQWIAPVVGSLIALPAAWLLGYMVQTVQYIAGLPFAMYELEVTWWQAVLAYSALIVVCVYMWRKTKLNLRDTNIVE